MTPFFCSNRCYCRPLLKLANLKLWRGTRVVDLRLAFADLLARHTRSAVASWLSERHIDAIDDGERLATVIDQAHLNFRQGVEAFARLFARASSSYVGVVLEALDDEASLVFKLQSTCACS